MTANAPSTLPAEAPARPAEGPSPLTLPITRSRRCGRFRLHVLEAGMQRLDGGAMFGVVPKPLWEKRIPADARNRIPLALRCLLVETAHALVLIDNGVGNKEDAKFRDIYGIENEGSPTRLEDALRASGFQPADVDIVIDTHLHFDHAGGNTLREAEDAPDVKLAFPNARYYVQQGEWEYAHRKNERIRASYLPHNFDPVMAAGCLELVRGEQEIVPGITLLPTPGHTPHHQSVLIESEGERAIFLADVMPTSAHLPLVWIMGYDVEPLVTLETKRSLLQRAREEDWLLIFEHDPAVAWGRLDAAAERPALIAE
jgi:glyoxylase-like metal-dependent hydrolase (beta-lactamase superfamily II)